MILAAPKVAALSLDSTSVLYIVPASLPIIQLSPLDRYNVRATQGLKISANFQLSSDQQGEHLILLQPSPTLKNGQNFHRQTVDYRQTICQ